MAANETAAERRNELAAIATTNAFTEHVDGPELAARATGATATAARCRKLAATATTRANAVAGDRTELAAGAVGTELIALGLIERVVERFIVGFIEVGHFECVVEFLVVE